MNIPSLYRSAVNVWLALMALLVISVATATLAPGPIGHMISLACAVAMAALIFVVFMGLRSADGLLRVFALGGFLWFGFMLGLTLLDFLAAP